MTSNVYIRTGLNQTITILKESYCTQPFKIVNITEDKKSEPLHLMLKAASPGILDGDEYVIRIDLEEGSSLQLQTQSYQRLFSMKKSASQLLEVCIKEFSNFCFIGHPIVPHKDSSFYSKNKLHLSEKNCTLTWGEILTCGRKLNGEVFQYSSFQNITEIFIDSKIILRENVCIDPINNSVQGIGKMEGYSHQATLIHLNDQINVTQIKKEITEWLITQPDILYGITSTPINGFILKILGNKGEQLYEILNSLNDIFIKPKKKEHVG